MNYQFKLVSFEDYCPLCEYKDYTEEQDPCWDCLQCPVNEGSRKPIYFKEKKGESNGK